MLTKKNADDHEAQTKAKEKIEAFLELIKEKKGGTELDLGYLGIITVPKELLLEEGRWTFNAERFKALKRVNLCSNKLYSIPSDLALLWINLEVLDLSDNQIISLPYEFCVLPQLKKLDVSKNQVVTVPKEYSLLTKLTSLNMSMNQIRRLPPELSSLGNSLVELTLYDNLLTELPVELSTYSKLKNLSLFLNKLTVFPKELAKSMVLLEGLELSNNQLEELPKEMSYMTSLRTLKLSSNPLKWEALATVVPSIASIENLVIENLKLETLPSQISKLRNLKVLKFRTGNQITGIPKEKDSPLPSLLLHLREFENKVPWNQLKLIFLGEEGVGKSTVIKLFQKNKTKIDLKKTKELAPSTNGIDISKWSITGGLKYSCYDMGGQEIFYPTHEFFLSGKCIFVIVFNLTNEDLTRVTYWLKKVRALTKPEQPVVALVGSKNDEFLNLPSELQGKIMKKVEQLCQNHNYGYHINFFRVSCANGDGISELKSFLKDLYNNKSRSVTTVLTKEIPIGYKKLLEVLADEERKFPPAELGNLEWKRFRRLATNANIPPTEVDNVAKFLHDAGIIVYYCDKKSPLDPLVILRPQSLATLMSDVISFKNRKTGIIKLSDLDNLWKNFPQETRMKLVSLLDSLEIAFRVKGQQSNYEDAIMIPSLLPEQLPANQVGFFWSSNLEEDELINGRIYQLAFVPLGFFSRLTTRLVHHFPNSETPVSWRNGVLIVNSSQRILLYFEPEKNRLNIHVRFPRYQIDSGHHHESMVAIVEAVDTLLENYYSTEVSDTEEPEISKLIPCPHCLRNHLIKNPGAAYFAGKSSNDMTLYLYKECVDAVTSGQRSIICKNYPNEPNAEVKINILAPDISLSGIRVITENELTIDRQIGKGGFGVVYKGFLKSDNDSVVDVALKELLIQHELTEREKVEKFEEFKRETQIMSGFNHPNLVKLYGIMVSPKLRMVMEFIPGGDLHNDFHIKDEEIQSRKKALKSQQREFDQEWTDFIGNLSKYEDKEKQKKFSAYETRRLELLQREDKILADQFEIDKKGIPMSLKLKVILDIASGMAYLHSFVPPIVHRDLRSPNIFLTSMNEADPLHAKVADFGLSRFSAGKLGEILKTWQWLAPEVIDVDSCQYDHRSDIYSFGIVCWEIMTGLKDLPFMEYSKNMKERVIIQQIINNNLRPTLPDSCPKPLADLILKCWERDPSKRPSFVSIIESISQILSSAPKTFWKTNLIDNSKSSRAMDRKSIMVGNFTNREKPSEPELSSSPKNRSRRNSIHSSPSKKSPKEGKTKEEKSPTTTQVTDQQILAASGTWLKRDFRTNPNNKPAKFRIGQKEGQIQ